MWLQSSYRGRQRVFLRTMRSPTYLHEVACTAKRNFDRECKKTFATKSALLGPCEMSDLSPQSGPLAQAAFANAHATRVFPGLAVEVPVTSAFLVATSRHSHYIPGHD